jgi:Acetoacetate decarboxylase (ADC)
MTTKPLIIAPAPWTLTGNGIILLYRFSRKWIEENGFLADYQQDSFKGIVGSVMLVDYHTSPVGPYRELLFIPGYFKMGGKNTFSISKIYVSSQESVWNGIENWGIPKELADFTIEQPDERSRVFTASLNDQSFFEATVKRGRFSFPFSSALFPFNITQRLGQDLLLTKPSAKGKAYFADIQNVKINSNLFPDLSALRPLAALVVEDFEMTFPVPTKTPTNL